MTIIQSITSAFLLSAVIFSSSLSALLFYPTSYFLCGEYFSFLFFSRECPSRNHGCIPGGSVEVGYSIKINQPNIDTRLLWHDQTSKFDGDGTGVGGTLCFARPLTRKRSGFLPCTVGATVNNNQRDHSPHRPRAWKHETIARLFFVDNLHHSSGVSY